MSDSQPIHYDRPNPDGLARLKANFLGQFSDFNSFAEHRGGYWTAEREYKDLLVALYRARLRGLVDADPGDLKDAHLLVTAVRAVLTTRLSLRHPPQNLMSWRFSDFLTLARRSEADTVAFAAALRDLLRGPGDSADRVERFNAAFAPIVAPAGPAITRSFPTLFLMLDRQDENIYVRTELYETAHRQLYGVPLFANAPLSAAEYRAVRAMAVALWTALAGWGWQPADMIDVHSFLWCAQDAPPQPKAGQIAPTVELEAAATSAFDHLLATLHDHGLWFSSDVVANYLLALQAKRFVILTGISGTGKTKLAQVVAEHYGHMDAAEPVHSDAARRPKDHCEIVAVRPDWTDSRGLLGYYNPLMGRYAATPFLRLLLRAGEELQRAEAAGREPHPFFVVLDEMNLARVEHYFSDFLSCMESGEPLHLHDNAMVESGESGDDDAVPMRLKIPANLYFTGTVNIDETTYMFSPKILDRAFTIELNEVDLAALGSAREGAAGSPPAPGQLHLARLPEQLTPLPSPGADDWRTFGAHEGGRLRQRVLDLQERLKADDRHFGYRVAVETARFVNLAVAQTAPDAESGWAALDLALLQKVLPKLHGTQQELDDVLTGLFAFAQEEPELPCMAAKIDRMRTRLTRQGFTSFIA